MQQGYEGPLAEFAALREEIQERVRAQQQLLTLQRRPHFLGLDLPLLLTFVGASLLALAWTASYVFEEAPVGSLARVGLVVVWLIGLSTSGLSTMLLLQMAGRLSVDTWSQTGLS